MEGLTKRTYIVAGAMVAWGAFMFFSTPKTSTKPLTENQLERLCPPVVGRMTYATSVEDSMCSYKMDQTTYDLLKPFGIVARTYTYGAKSFDAVIIASQSEDSFHNPQICFSAQGWEFEKQAMETVESKSQGVIPFTLLTMTNSKGDAKRTLAAYFYKGTGNKYYGATNSFKVGLFLAAMKGQSLDGVFYRVIPQYRAVNDEEQVKELKQFIRAWVDAAAESSKGYL